MLDAVVLSDIHLGSRNCQAARVSELLGRVAGGDLPAARLILNGDVFDSLDLRRLAPSHWRVLSQLRDLPDRGVETVWLAGNHDGPASALSGLLGVSVLDEYVLESGGRRLLVLHGDAFDSFLARRPKITAAADRVYRLLQRLDPSHRLARLSKHTSKTFIRCAGAVEAGAVALARQRNCSAVLCGHTHHACSSHADSAVAYYNSGCWTELPCTYLTVRDGAVALHDFGPAAT